MGETRKIDRVRWSSASYEPSGSLLKPLSFFRSIHLTQKPLIIALLALRNRFYAGMHPRRAVTKNKRFKISFYDLRYFGYTNTCAIHVVCMCAMYLACTPCQSLNMVSLSLRGFDETKKLEFRNSLDEPCTVTQLRKSTSQTDSFPGAEWGYLIPIQSHTPSACCKQWKLGRGGRLETRLAKYTELGLRLASFLPLPSLWSKGRTWLAWLQMNVVRILQHWVNFLLWFLNVFFTDISWLYHGNKCLQNETCKYSI